MEQKIMESLKKIYSQVPNFKCKHCHECCGPIIWFEPEELLIREYLEKFKIKRVIWTKEEFEKNQMKCPYLINNRCKIYPVRPIVCRLQGNIFELKCKSSKNNISMSKEKLDNVKLEFVKLIKQINEKNIFYSTLRFKSECRI